MNNHPDPDLLSTLLPVRRDRHALPSGRSVAVIADEHGERVELRAATGSLELTLELTPTGARLHVDAVDLSLRAKTITTECERYELRARESAVVRSAATTVESTEGDLTLRANDDVRASGERVLLNCDREDELPDWMASTLGAALSGCGSSRGG